MKALVTGASGHLGAHMCRVLLDDGFDVRAMVRKSSRLTGLRGLDVELVYGDVLDADSLTVATKNCDAVFHLGCPTKVEPGLFSTILKGTENILSASFSANVNRVVFTSSIATIGYSVNKDAVLDENTNQLTDASPYHVGKWHAERMIRDFTDKTGLDVVITNPATIIGALDYRVTPSNAPIQQCIDKGLLFAFDAGLTIVHVEDVAKGHLLAYKHGFAGNRYILGGTRVTVPDYFQMIAELCERPGPRLILPREALLLIGAGFSVLNFAKVKVPFTFKLARLAGRYGWYSSEKAQRELGYSWRPIRESISSYIAWKKGLTEGPRESGESCIVFEPLQLRRSRNAK